MSYADFDRVTHTPITVGTSTTVVIAANVNRRYLCLQNDSAEAIYLKLGAAGTLNQGIRLNISGNAGDRYEMTEEKGNLYKGAINGICTTGSKILLVTEGA